MKLSIVPLPKISHLISALFIKGNPDDMITDKWRSKSDKAFVVSKTAISLSIIVKAKQQELKRKNIAVWVPDYFCNISLAMVRVCGAIPVFYPVNENLQANINWCYNKLNECEADVFIHTHYFGDSNPIDQSAEFCMQTGAWLIEDAAHVFQPQDGVGEIGDFVLYSPHKFLAIPSGAIFVFRDQGINKLTSKIFESCIAIQNESIHAHALNQMDEIIWCIKRFLQKIGSAPKPIIAPFKDDKSTISYKIISAEIGNISRYLLSKELVMMNDIAEKRKENQLFWSTHLHILTHKEFELSNVHATPYLLPIKFKNKNDAEEVYWQLGKKGVPVQTWPDLPPEVVSENQIHAEAVMLRYRRFYLPVHQSLNTIKIKKRLAV